MSRKLTPEEKKALTQRQRFQYLERREPKSLAQSYREFAASWGEYLKMLRKNKS